MNATFILIRTLHENILTVNFILQYIQCMYFDIKVHFSTQNVFLCIESRYVWMFIKQFSYVLLLPVTFDGSFIVVLYHVFMILDHLMTIVILSTSAGDTFGDNTLLERCYHQWTLSFDKLRKPEELTIF